MQVLFAYLGVILIWSTTPLGIKWSGEQGISFLFGVTGRMVLGCLLAVAAVKLLRIHYHLHRQALKVYAVSGGGVFVAMLFGYWGATFIPSGWLSVIWGMTPIATGLLARQWLGETLTLERMLGLALSVLGLGVIFVRSQELDSQAWLGILLVLVAVVVQSATAVGLKWLKATEHGLSITAGGLVLAAPLFVLTWWLFDGQWPAVIPARAGSAIVYLAVVGTLIGFSFYYYLVKTIEASQVALINLITPVTSLMIGHWFNHEPVSLTIYLGTGLILLGLVCFQWGNYLLNRPLA